AAAALEQEGLNAITTDGRTEDKLEPEDFKLEEGGERRMVVEKDADEALTNLIAVLKDWLNEVLVADRMVVRSLADDLYDGQVLQILLHRLFNRTLSEPDVIHSAHGQRQRLESVLAALDELLGRAAEWTAEEIYGPAAGARAETSGGHRVCGQLPGRVTVPVLVVQKRDGALQYTRRLESVTGPEDVFCLADAERDMLDDIFERSPERSRHLMLFINSNLACLNIEVTDLARDLADGVNLIILLGLLEGYFAALHFLHQREQRVANVSLLFDLMEDAGILRPTTRPEELVAGDLKAALRVGLPIFSKYKSGRHPHHGRSREGPRTPGPKNSQHFENVKCPPGRHPQAALLTLRNSQAIRLRHLAHPVIGGGPGGVPESLGKRGSSRSSAWLSAESEAGHGDEDGLGSRNCRCSGLTRPAGSSSPPNAGGRDGARQPHEVNAGPGTCGIEFSHNRAAGVPQLTACRISCSPVKGPSGCRKQRSGASGIGAARTVQALR
uniref:Calponin-homology (CH) domain-containing protein n=1 Tax=Macrostomum lignano TaxID=282301 RepID=A0A1I8F367_9PLAT